MHYLALAPSFLLAWYFTDFWQALYISILALAGVSIWSWKKSRTDAVTVKRAAISAMVSASKNELSAHANFLVLQIPKLFTLPGGSELHNACVDAWLDAKGRLQALDFGFDPDGGPILTGQEKTTDQNAQLVRWYIRFVDDVLDIPDFKRNDEMRDGVRTMGRNVQNLYRGAQHMQEYQEALARWQ